jgi:predicted RNase H-like HicB family nuclease
MTCPGEEGFCRKNYAHLRGGGHPVCPYGNAHKPYKLEGDRLYIKGYAHFDNFGIFFILGCQFFGIVSAIKRVSLNLNFPVMSRNMQLNISLTPVLEHDIDTDRFLIYYREFPQAFAVGKTEDEAEGNLIPLVELMWKERPRELEKVLLEKYINDAHRKDPEIVKG